MNIFSIHSLGLVLLVSFYGCSDNRATIEDCVQGSANFTECVNKRIAQQEAFIAERKARALNLADDSIGYLYELSLIRGHLWVGHQLAMSGHKEHAIMHAKHPEDEIYSSLIEVFRARRVEGFAEELQGFSDSVESGNIKRIKKKYQELIEAVHQSYSSITLNTEGLLDLVNRLMKQAAAEYAVGILDGKVDNVHEYQDARGFTEIALLWTRSHIEESSLSEGDLLVTGLLKEKLEDVLVMWPGLVPSDEVPFDASRLYGLAADVEIMILSL